MIRALYARLQYEIFWLEQDYRVASADLERAWAEGRLPRRSLFIYWRRKYRQFCALKEFLDARDRVLPTA